jgi:hypothetical protein
MIMVTLKPIASRKILKTGVLRRSIGISYALLTLLKFRQMQCCKRVSESNGAQAAAADLGLMAGLSPMDGPRRGYGKGQLQTPERRVEGARKELNCLPTSSIQLREECRQRSARFSTTNEKKTACLGDLVRQTPERAANRVNDHISFGSSLFQCEVQQQLRLR